MRADYTLGPVGADEGGERIGRVSGMVFAPGADGAVAGHGGQDFVVGALQHGAAFGQGAVLDEFGQHGARQRGHLRGNFPQLGQGDGVGRVCQRFAQGGDQARLVVFGELLHVHTQRLADFEQHGHGERALVLLDLVQVTGRDAQRVRQGCLRQAALGAQTAQLQAQAERERFRALRAERDRAVNRADIAAELHDSVGHGLTTIIALSEGLAGGADPEIDEALGGINEVARECLEQTRRAVRALADGKGESTESPDRYGAGHRSWDEIRSVVGRVRSLGVTVVFTETGQRADDAGQADLCFALTREALTNAVRHAPALSQVQVSWDHGESAVTVTVRNDGASGDSGGEDDGCRGGSAEGTGLPRLRDRVEVAGGSLDWGPESDGGWLVTATVPRTRGEG